jgi:hypothetical protein
MNGEDHFADFDEETTSQPAAPSSDYSDSSDQSEDRPYRQNHGGGGRFADEIFSEKISARMRTFFVDVKESSNGKFLKISEKSRGGKKSTIMMDSEDLPAFIEALQNAEKVL